MYSHSKYKYNFDISTTFSPLLRYKYYIPIFRSSSPLKAENKYGLNK